MSSTVASRRENWRRWEKSDYDVTNERQTKEADYEDGLIDEEGNGNGSHKWQQSHNSQQRSSSRKRPCEFVRDISERRVSGGPKSEPCPSPSKTGDILSRNLSTPSHKDRYPPAASKTQVKAVCSAHHNTEDHKMCNNRVSTMLPQKGGFSSFRETTTMDGGAIPGNRHATRDRGRAFSPRRGAEGGFFASQGDGSFDRSWDTDRYDRRSPSESKSSISPGLPTSRFQPASSVKTVANQLADNRGDNTRDDKSNNSYGGRQLQHRAGSWRDREQSSLRQPQREDHHSRRQPQQQHRGSFLSNQVKKQRLPQQESDNCEYPRHKLERGDDVTRRNEGYSRRPQQYHQHSSCLDSPSSRNEGNLPRQPQPYQHRGTAETAGARGQRPYQQQRRLGEDSSRSSRGGSRSRPGFHQPPSKNAHRQAENYFHCGTKEEGPPQNHQLTNHQDSKSPLDVDSRGQRPQPNRRRSFDSSGTSLRGTESSQNGYSARPHRQHRSSMDDSCSSSYNGQGQSSQQHHPDRHQGSFRTSSFPKRHSTYTHHSELSNNHRPEEDDFRRSRLSFDDSRFRQEQQQRRAPHGQNINNSTEQPPASHSQDHQYSILDEQEQQYSQKKRKVSEEMQERNHTPLGKRWCNEERGADVSMQTAQLAGSPTKSLGKRWCPPQVSKHDATAETPNVPSTHDLGRTHQNTEIETSAVSSKSIEDSKKNDKRSNGIPLRWVKPSANPKKKLKGTSPKKQDEIAPPTVKGNEGKEKKFVSSSSQKGGVVYSKNSNKVCGKELEREKMSCGNAAKTGKTQDTNRPMRPPSPLVDRMVTDSEGGSTVSNNRDLLVMLSTERAQEQCIPSAIELPKPQKVRNVVACT